MSRPTTPRDLASWPQRLRRAADGIATMLMQAFHLARARALESPSPTVRALAERNGFTWESELQGREIAVFRRRLEAMEPLKRPHIPPQDRFEVIQLMRLRGWSIEETARCFVLHPNTLRDWLRRFDGRASVKDFFGKATPFNKISDAARWLVHEIRALCPEREFGTRSIAMAIVRAGLKLSRSSVQRILREKKPERPKPEALVRTPPRRPFRTPFSAHGRKTGPGIWISRLWTSSGPGSTSQRSWTDSRGSSWPSGSTETRPRRGTCSRSSAAASGSSASRDSWSPIGAANSGRSSSAASRSGRSGTPRGGRGPVNSTGPWNDSFARSVSGSG